MKSIILDHGVDILNPGEPQSLMIVGILLMLLWAAINYRNTMAAISWAGNVMVLVLVGIFRLGVEFFWLSIVATVMLLIAGLTVRWTG